MYHVVWPSLDEYYAKIIYQIDDWMLAKERRNILNCYTFTFLKLLSLFMDNRVNFWGDLLLNRTFFFDSLFKRCILPVFIGNVSTLTQSLKRDVW